MANNSSGHQAFGFPGPPAPVGSFDLAHLKAMTKNRGIDERFLYSRFIAGKLEATALEDQIEIYSFLAIERFFSIASDLGFMDLCIPSMRAVFFKITIQSV